MPSYRFCRPDDIPLLVAAWAACCWPEYPHEPQPSVERYKAEMRALNLWPSSCMIAMEGAKPAAVLLGCKRSNETLIYKLGVQPEFRSDCDYQTHLLSSLSAKLAVLGPRRILAEIPLKNEPLVKLFESLGYIAEQKFCDFRYRGEISDGNESSLLSRVTVAEVLANDALFGREEFAWERSSESILNKKEKIEGIALASVDKLEAYLLFEENPSNGETNILRFYCREKDRELKFYQLLINKLAREKNEQLVVKKISEDELTSQQLRQLGFEQTAEYARYSANASAN